MLPSLVLSCLSHRESMIDGVNDRPDTNTLTTHLTYLPTLLPTTITKTIAIPIPKITETKQRRTIYIYLFIHSISKLFIQKTVTNKITNTTKWGFYVKSTSK